MAAIVATLVNVFTSLFGYLQQAWDLFASFFEQLWGAGMTVLDVVLSAVAALIVFGIEVFANIQMFALEQAVALLPMMPVGTDIGDFSIVSLANRYVPLGEIAALGTVWAMIYGLISAWKLAKFVAKL